jgi:hypothetical protein
MNAMVAQKHYSTVCYMYNAPAASVSTTYTTDLTFSLIPDHYLSGSDEEILFVDPLYNAQSIDAVKVHFRHDPTHYLNVTLSVASANNHLAVHNHSSTLAALYIAKCFLDKGFDFATTVHVNPQDPTFRAFVTELHESCSCTGHMNDDRDRDTLKVISHEPYPRPSAVKVVKYRLTNDDNDG